MTETSVRRPDQNDNVFFIDFGGVKAGWSQDILVRSDAHHDNLFSDHKLEKRHLDQAREKNAPIIDLGDMFCAMQGKYDPRADANALREELRGDDYFDKLVEYNAKFYEPYKDLFCLVAQGNHEYGVLAHNQTNLTKRLCERLGIMEAPYSGWIGLRFHFGGRKFVTHWLVYSHGSGGSAPVTRGVLAVNRMALCYPDAAVVATGHTHDEWIMAIARNRVNSMGRQTCDRQLHIKSPGYQASWLLSRGKSWERRRDFQPKTHGAIWLTAHVEDGDVMAAKVRLSARLAE